MVIPKRGDLIWVNFDPQAGHEQAGRRPALVLSAERFNRSTGLLLACPITSRVRGYHMEIALPPESSVQGVVLVHHARSLDWRVRQAEVIEAAPMETLYAVLDILSTLLEDE